MKATAPEKFFRRVNREGPIPASRPELGPCHLWTGYVNPRTGYGEFYDGRKVTAPRWAWSAVNGPVPEGAFLDHLCHSPDDPLCVTKRCLHRLCCNAGHLEPVTARENTLRGINPCAVNARKTHCKRNHPLSGDNLRLVPDGRRCRACTRESNRRRRAAHARR